MTTTRSVAAGTAALDRVDGDRQRLDHRRVLERERRRAACGESAPARRRTRRRRRAPVVGARDAEHHPRVAQVHLAATAEVAAAAIDRRVERDAIAGREAGHRGAGLFDRRPAASWPITSGGMRRQSAWR